RLSSPATAGAPLSARPAWQIVGFRRHRSESLPRTKRRKSQQLDPVKTRCLLPGRRLRPFCPLLRLSIELRLLRCSRVSSRPSTEVRRGCAPLHVHVCSSQFSADLPLLPVPAQPYRARYISPNQVGRRSPPAIRRFSNRYWQGA